MDVSIQTKLLGATDGKWGAGQGIYYKAMNGTPGTGIVGPTVTAFNVNSALVEVQNPTALPSVDGSATSTYLVLDYIKLLVTAADVAGTSIQYLGVLDPILRYSAGGTQPIPPEFGPVNVLNMNNASFMPQAAWHFGAVATTNASANRLIMARGCMKANAAAPIAVVNDEYYWSFGQAYDVGAGALKTGTTPSTYRQNCGPVVVPPQSSFVLHAWSPALTGAYSFEFECGWWELPTAGTIGAQ